MKRSKYGVRTDAAGIAARTVDNIRFDSLKEAKRYQELKLLKRAGKISDVGMQPQYLLEVNGQLICKYVADFQYLDLETQKVVTEDCKGMKTRIFRLKKKLMKAIYGIEIKET